MLYGRWRQVACEWSDQIALVDLDAGREWTFGGLDAFIENDRADEDGGVCFPRGNRAEFIFEVLRGWRFGRVVCPLELDQPPVEVSEVPEGCVHLKCTSATTGPRRMIAFNSEQLGADAANIVGTMGLRREWPNLGVISLAHSYGFSNLVLPLLLHGIPLYLANSAFPDVMRRAAGMLRQMTVPAVPALWRAWVEAGVLGREVKLAISAGAPLGLEIEREAFERCDVKIHNFYGASECGGIAYDRTLEPRRESECIGQAMENVRLEVDANGCLRVSSAAVGMTYWPQVDESLGRGFYQTGDLAEIREGIVFLRGRMSDLINVAGRKISPEVVERVIRSHEAVKGCVVFGIGDPHRGEQIVAGVVLRVQDAGTKVKEYVQERLPAWQTPRHWWLVEDLPVNERGKISRGELRKRYLDFLTK